MHPFLIGLLSITLGNINSIIHRSRSLKASMDEEVVTFGPFGGHGGNQWDDETCIEIMKFKIFHGSVIHAIQIKYNKDGEQEWSDKHGGNDGEEYVVELHPLQEIHSIWGYYCSDSAFACVQSLTIQTTTEIHGPFGTEKGKYFSFSSTNGKIIGFHGRSSHYLDSIGVYFYPDDNNPFQPHMIVGPIGGYSGDKWDDGVNTGVRKITIYARHVVDSIEIEYDDNGHEKLSERYGRPAGGIRNRISFHYPDEYLRSIEGYYSSESAFGAIQSLTIHSNTRSYGPYGTETGTHFEFPSSSGGKIIGLHGRFSNDLGLESIGAYYLIGENSLKDGPFGGGGGDEWDDGNHSAVRQLKIYSAGSVIDAIQIEYDDNGRSKWCTKRGRISSSSEYEVYEYPVKLDYPEEYLLSIHGHMDTISNNLRVVRSITIVSNTNTHGPYGAENGTCFQCEITDRKIVGFHGRSGNCLDSIGAHFEPIA